MGQIIYFGSEVLATDTNHSLVLMVVMLGLAIFAMVILFVYAQKGNNKATSSASNNLSKVIESSTNVTTKVMSYVERNTGVLDSYLAKLAVIDDTIKNGFKGVETIITETDRKHLNSNKELFNKAIDETKEGLTRLEANIVGQLMPLSTALTTLQKAIEGMHTTSISQNDALVKALEAIQKAQREIVKTAENTALTMSSNGIAVLPPKINRSFTQDEDTK